MMATWSRTDCGTPENSSAISCVLPSFLWMNFGSLVDLNTKDLRARGALRNSVLLSNILGWYNAYARIAIFNFQRTSNLWNWKIQETRSHIASRKGNFKSRSLAARADVDWLWPPPINRHS